MTMHEGLSRPARPEQPYMPFPTAYASGMLDDLSDFNQPQVAAHLVSNGIMPEKRGVIERPGEQLAAFDLVARGKVSRAECVLPPTHIAAVNGSSRKIQDTGVIIFSDEERFKVYGEVVTEADAFIAAQRGRLVKLGSGLVQVIYGFGLLPDFEIKSRVGGELRGSPRRKLY